jgi:adenylate kinase family enzyme
MRRVVVVGSYGAGKTTLARRLGELLGLEVFHLDALRWLPGWRLRPRPEWDALLERLVAGDRWIVDGNFEQTLEPRLRRADTVVVLDFPVLLSFLRVVRRRLARGARVDLADGCEERLNLQPLVQALGYRRRERRRIFHAVNRHVPDGTRVIVLRRPAQVEQLLARLDDEAQAPGEVAAGAAQAAAVRAPRAREPERRAQPRA